MALSTRRMLRDRPARFRQHAGPSRPIAEPLWSVPRHTDRRKTICIRLPWQIHLRSISIDILTKGKPRTFPIPIEHN